MIPARGITILVVEDSPVQAEMLRRSLLEAGYGVEVARNGAEGLEAARRLRPAVIVSDINMPVMDGYAMCAAIRADESLAGISVILVTTLSDPGYVLRGLLANADAYLTKPYNLNSLITWIGNLLANPPKPTVDRRRTEILVHGEGHPVQVNPQRMANLLMSIYENSLQQYRELIDAQAELESLNTSLETRVIEQTAAVRSSERRLHALLLHGEGLVLTTDPDGAITYVGPTAERVLGYLPEELLGRSLLEYSHPDDRPRAGSVFSDLRHQPSGMVAWEQRFLRAGGAWITFSINAKNVVKDPSIGGYVINLRDITLQKQDEEHIRKLSLAVEQSPAMIAIVDASANIEYANEAYVRTTGYRRDEVIGHNPRMMKSGKTPPESYQQLWSALAKGQGWIGEFINRRKDGTEYTSAAQISPIRQADGSITHYLAVQEDVTERRRNEAELEQYRLHLEELVDSRTKELNEARERAEQASRAKSEFLASMSHEMRTPMNAVIGLTHLLRTKVEQADQIDMLDKIASSGSHLLSVINNILDQAKIEAGKLVLVEQPLDLSEILSFTLNMFDEAAVRKEIRLVAEVGDCFANLAGDRTRLVQCLINLTANAIRHTPSGTVTLRIGVVSDEPERQLVKFAVIDSGVGIDVETLSKLFAPFEQGTARGDLSPSSGLGLVITRRLAQMMGGDAGAESVPSIGSTFWFTAWLRKGEAGRAGVVNDLASSIEVLRRHATGKRILLVDDNPLNRLVGRQLLEQAALIVDEAEDGFAALEAIRQSADRPYCLVLMDMEMPGMGGLETTRQIRATGGGGYLPIVAMTANAFGEDREACLAAGMNDHIAKPVEPQVLYSKICQWLNLAVSKDPVGEGASRPPGNLPVQPRGSAEQRDIDIAFLARMANGQLPAMRRLLENFSEHHRQDGEQLSEQLERQAWDEARRLAHSLKGSAGQIGARELECRARAVEEALRKGSCPDSEASGHLQSALSGAIAYASRWLEVNPMPAPADTISPVSPDEVAERLRHLQLLLETIDGQALAEAEHLANLLPANLSKPLAAEFSAIVSATRAFNLEEASQRLQRILPQLEESIT